VTARFWDKIADRYHERPVADEEAYRKKLEKTQSYLRPDMRILEFGCGTGTTAIAHAPFVERVTAIDYSPRMIEICRDNARSAGIRNITFECAGIDDFDAAPESFDAVLGLSVLHLVQDPGRAIEKAHELLKPGGIFVSSTACIGETPFRLLKYVAGLGRAMTLMPLLKFFTRKQLEQSIMGRDFAIDHSWHPKRNAAVFIVARKP
jgi:2-polyprenyl-3-methyl-5-hydroxy-6-metoxy-1,4-benzoquinol methylase